MVKTVIDDDEFARLESEKRHDELIGVLKQIAARKDDKDDKNVERILAQHSRLLETLIKKDYSTDLRPLIAELSKALKPAAPKSFRVERNKIGLIERVIVE